MSRNVVKLIRFATKKSIPIFCMKKIFTIRTREEINRINKKTNIKVACMKRELKFWQIISVGTVVMGMLLGWML